MVEFIASDGVRGIRVWGYHERHARHKATLAFGHTNFTLARAAGKVPVYLAHEA